MINLKIYNSHSELENNPPNFLDTVVYDNSKIHFNYYNPVIMPGATYNPTASVCNFFYKRTVADGSTIYGCSAHIKSIKGNTIGWYALSAAICSWSSNQSNNTLTKINTNTWQLVITVGGGSYISLRNSSNSITRMSCGNSKGNQYYIGCYIWKEGGNGNMANYGGGILTATNLPNYTWVRLSKIHGSISPTRQDFGFSSAADRTNFVKTPFVCNITTLLGNTNHITNKKFESIFYWDMYGASHVNANNSPQIIHFTNVALRVIGTNMWDEQYEIGNYTDTGEKEIENPENVIRSKNLITVLSSTTYYFNLSSENISKKICCYDSNKNFIRTLTITSNIFTTDAITCYIAFNLDTTYGTEYKNDIIITTVQNQQYKPYYSYSFNIDITKYTGKLNGEGESVQVFPDGMKSVSNLAFDEIIKENNQWVAYKRVKIVNLGTYDFTQTEDRLFQTTISDLKPILNEEEIGHAWMPSYTMVIASTHQGPSGETPSLNWSLSVALNKVVQFNYTSATTPEEFKTYANNRYLLYELETPLRYVLDNCDILDEYYVENGGIEMLNIEPSNIPYTSPINMDIDYYN